MHLPASWVLLALMAPAQPAPLPKTPIRPGPIPVQPPPPADLGPMLDPPDEQVLKDARVAADANGLLEFFRQRVGRPGEEERIRALVRQLGDDDFDRREDASLQLDGLGLRAKPFLLAALRDPDAEIASRARDCLKQIDEGTASASTAAAIRVLAKVRPDGAADALLAYLPSADDMLAEQVRLSLADLAVRDGKADAALVRALTDPLPARRAAAAFALARAGAQDQLPAVKKLLQDPDPLVRYRAALGLAAEKDKDAVPALIDLLDQLPRLEASRAEELLYRVADAKAPATPASLDAAARRKHRDDWKAWWAEHGAAVDADKMADAARTVGYTLVVLLDQGRVLELDSANHPRLQISQLSFPLDAQLLPDDHVLVTEHNTNRVTERDATGKIVWQKDQLLEAIASQRLPNGNTFIATKTQLMELKPNGDEAFSYTPPNGETIMKAQKLPNGDIAMVTQLGVKQFVLLDAKGRAQRSFNVDLGYSGGRIDVTPEGHVLIPEAENNRVVELDSHGSVVWQAAAEGPIAAVRLANGDTLVTTFAQHRAVELDRDGKEVWEARRDTRVTRAFRR